MTLAVGDQFRKVNAPDDETHVLYEVMAIEYTGNHRDVKREEDGWTTIQSIVRIDAAVVQ